MKIEIIETGKSELCEKILRSLPEWFGIESAIVEYSKDVQRMPMLVAKLETEVVGFLSLKTHNKYTAEIHVMGVLPEFHRQKAGRDLVSAAERYLSKRGYRYLTVKTLSESRPNEEYDRTCNFYYSVGFIPVEEFKTLWSEHNPCLLLIKEVRSTGLLFDDAIK
jgi:ribosomal protein S18 acetylase RimI-like enzyme